MVRKPALLVADADEILERGGDPRLTVRLELGEVDEHVGVEYRVRDAVTVVLPVVRLAHPVLVVCRSAPKTVGESRHLIEFTVATQVELRVSARIARLRPASYHGHFVLTGDEVAEVNQLHGYRTAPQGLNNRTSPR